MPCTHVRGPASVKTIEVLQYVYKGKKTQMRVAIFGIMTDLSGSTFSQIMTQDFRSLHLSTFARIP